jgi:hypothetical protein
MDNLTRYLTIYEPRTCPLCGKALHAWLCAPMRAAMADPPDGPPLVLEEAPDEECPEEY